MSNAIHVLKERGLLEDLTSDKLIELVESPLSIYAGFDPSSPSLQAGNLVAIIVRRGRFRRLEEPVRNSPVCQLIIISNLPGKEKIGIKYVKK